MVAGLQPIVHASLQRGTRPEILSVEFFGVLEF
jgi:hypothetical protein